MEMQIYTLTFHSLLRRSMQQLVEFAHPERWLFSRSCREYVGLLARRDPKLMPLLRSCRSPAMTFVFQVPGCTKLCRVGGCCLQISLYVQHVAQIQDKACWPAARVLRVPLVKFEPFWPERWLAHQYGPQSATRARRYLYGISSVKGINF